MPLLHGYGQVLDDDKIDELHGLIYDKDYVTFHRVYDSLSSQVSLSDDDYIHLLNAKTLCHRLAGDMVQFKEESFAAIDFINQKFDSLHALKSPLYYSLITNTMFVDFEFSERMRGEWRTYLDSTDDPAGENGYLRTLGNSQALKGDYYAAVKYYEESLLNASFYYPDEEFSAYLNLAYFYSSVDNIVGRRVMNDMAIEFGKSMKYPDYKNLCLTHQILADITMIESTGVIDLEKALVLAEESLRYAKLGNYKDGIGVGYELFLTVYLKLAMIQNRELNEAKALTYLDSMRVIMQEMEQDENMAKPAFMKRGIGKLAEYYIFIEDPEQSQVFLDGYRNLESQYSIEESYFLERCGRAALLKDDYATARRYMKDAICAAFPNWSDCPAVSKRKTPYFRAGHYYFARLANIEHRRYMGNTNLETLSDAYSAFSTYDSLVAVLQGTMTNPTIDYSTGIDIAYAYYLVGKEDKWIDEALLYIEKQKNYSLLSDFDLDQRIKESSASDSLRSRLDSLRANMEDKKALSERLMQSGDASASNQQIKYLQAASDYLKFQRKVFNADTSDQIGQKIEAITPEMIQDKIGWDDNLLTYIYGSDRVYAIVLNRERVEFLRLPTTKVEVDSLTELLFNQIQRKDNGVLQSLTQLHELLVSPLVDYLVGDLLTIMPDENLHKLPFGLLQDSGGQYLIEQWGIRYTHSFGAIEKTDTLLPEENRLVAFAASPSMNNFNRNEEDVVRSGLSALPAAKEEIDFLKRNFNGGFYSDDAATESAFKTSCSSGTVIHLAMHGLVNQLSPINSSLLFSQEEDPSNDGYLRANEIARLDLNANLVTLSACNSGFGELPSRAVADRGFGVQSLSNAFFMSGAKSVVASLWPVHDQSSYEIMRVFYQELQQGTPKYEAIRRAQLTFLNEQPQWKRHPYYWGGFVYLGDDGALALGMKNSRVVSWWLLGIPLLLLFLWYFRGRLIR